MGAVTRGGLKAATDKQHWGIDSGGAVVTAGRMTSTSDLWVVPPNKLDHWIMEVLQPSTDFCTQVKKTVKNICDFLKEQCFEDIRVLKTVKVSTIWHGGQLAPLLPPLPLSSCSSFCPTSFSPGSSMNGDR